MSLLFDCLLLFACEYLGQCVNGVDKGNGGEVLGEQEVGHYFICDAPVPRGRKLVLIGNQLHNIAIIAFCKPQIAKTRYNLTKEEHSKFKVVSIASFARNRS